jgi:hypothetical protein
MNAIGYFTAFAAIGGILALSTSYAERRNLKTWAPNAVVNTPKLVATTAVPSPKLAAAALGSAAAVGSAAVQEPVLMASSPEPTAIAQPPPMRDPDETSALPKQAEAAAPQVPRALSHPIRKRMREARPSSRLPAPPRISTRTRPMPVQPSREPIQFRLAEGRN